MLTSQTQAVTPYQYDYQGIILSRARDSVAIKEVVPVDAARTGSHTEDTQCVQDRETEFVDLVVVRLDVTGNTHCRYILVLKWQRLVEVDRIHRKGSILTFQSLTEDTNRD